MRQIPERGRVKLPNIGHKLLYGRRVVDAVLHRRSGTYGLIEIKLGGEGLIEEGAANLKSLAEKVDTTRMKAPSFMMVLTGTGAYAYRRKDGVYVVPIGCLKD